MQAKIVEVFKSIQGEGLYCGTVQVFVRFAQCNINCDFCDTDSSEYKLYTVDQLLDEVNKFEMYHSVSITGGEPLLQADFLKEFCKRLKSQGKEIHLETNGTLFEQLKKVIDFVDVVAMDIKLPSTTKDVELWQDHDRFLDVALKKHIFVKSVVNEDTTKEDVFRAAKLIAGKNNGINFILQPQHPFEDSLAKTADDLRKVALSELVSVKVMPQLHKVLGLK